MGDFFLSAEVGDVVEGFAVGDAGEEDFGAVVGEEAVRLGLVDRFDLGDGLPDGDELDSDSRAGGSDLWEPSEWGVRGFVEYGKHWRDWLVDFRPDRPNIAAWYESFSRRTSMTATVPDDTPDA